MFVVVITLPGTSEHFTQTCSGTAVIGRSEGCDIRLTHPLVSRRHAEIASEADGRFLVRDLGSRNGTIVNGQSLRSSEIRTEDSVNVQIGPYLLLLAPPATGDSTTILFDVEQKATRLELDRDTRCVLVDRKLVLERVSVLEYRLLDALDSAAPALVENRNLGDVIWGTDQWDIYMLHNLIRRIRRKLEEAGMESDELIATVPGVGYRLV